LKIAIFHTPLHSTPPLGGSRWKTAVTFDTAKMVWLLGGENV